MSYNKLLVALIILISFFGCSSDNEKKTATEAETLNSRVKNIQYEIISQKGDDQGLKITNISFDTISLHKDTKGLLVTFNIEASPKAFDSITFGGFNSYFIDLTCQSDEGKVYAHRNEVFKDSDKKKFLHSNRECFISHSSDRNLEISFPYRMLEMTEGEHELTIHIDAFPAKFEDDSSSLDMKMLNQISKDPKASVALKIKVKAPKLYKTSITVHKFKLNTQLVKPEKFDFAMGGSGYPDLFWEVYCGNDYLFYSPVEKNKVEYLKKHSTPTFYCTQEDIINLAVVDYDNGPFNTQDDIIEKWMGRINTLKNRIDTLRFGNLEYLVVETKVE